MLQNNKVGVTDFGVGSFGRLYGYANATQFFRKKLFSESESVAVDKIQLF